jgi:hypothetical protein
LKSQLQDKIRARECASAPFFLRPPQLQRRWTTTEASTKEYNHKSFKKINLNLILLFALVVSHIGVKLPLFPVSVGHCQKASLSTRQGKQAAASIRGRHPIPDHLQKLKGNENHHSKRRLKKSPKKSIATYFR